METPTQSPAGPSDVDPGVVDPGVESIIDAAIDPAVAAVVDDDRRTVALDGVHNFRDLGGYPALGGSTRWGLVYRADGLGRLTSDDVVALRERGLGTVIDLRTHHELDERGRYPVEQHEDVVFHHLPVIDQTWQADDMPEIDNAHDFLIWAYRDMLQAGGAKIGTALQLIADPAVTPVVFHCAAGKDRTGLVAAMLLAVLGVPEDYIAADYAKTAVGMARMRAGWAAWAAEQGEDERNRMAAAPAFYFESPPLVMTALLAELRETHGSLLDFVRTLGITDDHIASLRTRLIEPAA